MRPIRRSFHLLQNMVDIRAGRAVAPRRVARWRISGWFSLLLLLVFTVLATSQNGQEAVLATEPLAVDSGSAGLQLMLRRLSTTARLVHTTEPFLSAVP